MTPRPFPRRAAPSECAIRAHAAVAAARSQVETLRDAAPPAGAPPLPPRFLRHCDEHTVVAVRAVLEGLASLQDPPARGGCGVVAAPCQAGRLMAARSLAQLHAGGAVTVSPHIVPQGSLHSIAGAVSVALGMHGPHLGIGGGPDALAEGLFAALTLLHGGGCDAVWLIASEWDTEPVLDAGGAAGGDPVCRALALLLTPPAAGGDDRLSLTLVPGEVAGDPPPTVALAEFCRAVEMCAAGSALTAWGVACPWGAEIRLAAHVAAVSASPRAVRRHREAA